MIWWQWREVRAATPERFRYSPPMRDEEQTTISSREVGARMRRIREERGLTIAELAGKVRVTAEQLHGWESGLGVAPYETMLAIAAALGTTPNAFVQPP